MADGTALASEYADGVRDSIEEMMTEYAAYNAPGDDTNESALEALDEYPLELVWQKGAPFEVVITVGGPDARIVHDVRWNDWTLVVRWGTDTASERRSEHITAMGEYFLTLVDDDA